MFSTRSPMRRLVLAAVLLPAVVGRIPEAQRPGQVRTASAEAEFAALVDEARLRETVRTLVGFGARMGGTPSGEVSAAHLRARFAGHGLTADLLDDPPLWASWTESWRVELDGSGAPLESAHPLLFSPSVSPARSGRLIEIEAFSPALARPSWEEAVLYTAEAVDERAYEHLARGPHVPLAVLSSAPHSAKNLDWSRLGKLPEREHNAFPVFAVSMLDGETLRAAAARGGRVRLSLVSHARRAPPRTVIATLPGRDNSRYYLVAAHGDSDSGGPGADDNASGVAAVLEIARVLSAQVAAGTLRPAVAVRFVIWGAEEHSARAYIDREGRAIEQCLGVLNFDQVGTGASREAIYIEGTDVPWNERLVRLLEAVGRDYLDQPGFWADIAAHPTLGGTDAFAFLPPAYKGRGYTTARIPAVTIYTAAWDEPRTVSQAPGWEPESVAIDYSLYYHSSGDTPENTTEREPQNMVRAVKLAGIALLRLLTA